MNLVLQPAGSNQCGQACVAMVAGVSIEKVIGAIGHRHSTKTREIVAALKALGVECDPRLKRFKNPLLELRTMKIAIIKVRFNGRLMGHWVVWNDGKILDPAGNAATKIGRWTSFLRIWSKED